MTTALPSSPPLRAWVIWAVAVAAYMLAVTNRTSLAAVGLDAADRFHADASTLSLFAVLQLGVYGVMQIPVGVLLDRFGARPRHSQRRTTPSAASPTFTWPTCRPISHSVVTAVGAAVLAWLILEKRFGRALLGRAVGLGMVSHLILNLATHGHDIVLWPGLATPKLGLGLYTGAPMAAFFVELIYGVFCWYVHRGGPGLLAFRRDSRTFGEPVNILSPDIPGPQHYLAGRPLVIVTLILVQIVVSLVLVGVLARRRSAASTQVRHVDRRYHSPAWIGGPSWPHVIARQFVRAGPDLVASKWKSPSTSPSATTTASIFLCTSIPAIVYGIGLSCGSGERGSSHQSGSQAVVGCQNATTPIVR